MPNRNNQQFIVGLIINRYVLIFLGILVVGLILWHFSDIVAWVLVAWVLSMLGRPLMDIFLKIKLGRFQMGSGMAAGMTILCFFLIVGLFIAMFVPMFISQARNLASVDYYAIAEALEEPMNQVDEYLKKYELSLSDFVSQEESSPSTNPMVPAVVVPQDSVLVEKDTSSTHVLDTMSLDSTGIDSVVAPRPPPTSPPLPIVVPSVEKKKGWGLFGRFSIREYLDIGNITSWVGSIVGVAGSLFIAVVSITFIAFFFLKEAQLFTRTLQNLTPASFDKKIVHAVQESSHMLTRYFGGVILQITIITVGIWLGLTFLGVPNALLIAFFAAMMNVIPYVGPVIGAVFGLILTISSNLSLDFYSQMLPLLGKASIIFAIMQMVDNFILQPFIFSNRVYAHPLEIFIIVLIGAKMGGIMGMVIAIPSYTVIRIIAKNFLSEFDIIQNITKGLDEGQKEDEHVDEGLEL